MVSGISHLSTCIRDKKIPINQSPCGQVFVLVLPPVTLQKVKLFTCIQRLNIGQPLQIPRRLDLGELPHAIRQNIKGF